MLAGRDERLARFDDYLRALVAGNPVQHMYFWSRRGMGTTVLLETTRVVDRHRVGYRIRWSAPDQGTFVFEQQAFYDTTGGRIAHLQLVCSGDRPLPS